MVETMRKLPVQSITGHHPLHLYTHRCLAARLKNRLHDTMIYIVVSNQLALHVVKPLVSQADDGSVIQVPALALWYTVPSDGLPHLAHWANTASDVLRLGYEAHREPLEVKKRDPGQHMAMLEVTKGAGRTSIILFALVWSYLEMGAAMSDAELRDFKRPAGYEQIRKAQWYHNGPWII